MATALSILALLGWILLFALAGLLGLALLLVCLPFHLRAEGQVDGGSADGEAGVRWAWGVLAVKARRRGLSLYLAWIRVWTFPWTSDKKEAPGPQEQEAPDKPRRKRRKGWLWTHRRVLWRHFVRFRRALRLRLRIRGVIGLGDPAETASLFQGLALLQGRRSIDLQITPEWLDEELELAGRASARIWLLHLLLIVVAELWNKDTRTMIRAARAARM